MSFFNFDKVVNFSFRWQPFWQTISENILEFGEELRYIIVLWGIRWWIVAEGWDSRCMSETLYTSNSFVRRFRSLFWKNDLNFLKPIRLICTHRWGAFLIGMFTLPQHTVRERQLTEWLKSTCQGTTKRLSYQQFAIRRFKLYWCCPIFNSESRTTSEVVSVRFFLECLTTNLLLQVCSNCWFRAEKF